MVEMAGNQPGRIKLSLRRTGNPDRSKLGPSTTFSAYQTFTINTWIHNTLRQPF